MKYYQLIVAWALLYASTSAMALDPKIKPVAVTPPPIFQYTAETLATVRQQGTVSAGGLSWSCAGVRCNISGPWPTPGVSSCKALAGMVGAIRSYGHDRGAQLDASQLAQCNAGLPASPAKPLAVQPLTPAVAVAPVTHTPAAGLAPPPAPATPVGPRKAPAMTALPAPQPATPSVATATSSRGGVAGAASPGVDIPAARQLTNINPAVTRQLLALRTEKFTSLKREVESRRAAAEAEAQRRAAQIEEERRRGVYPGSNGERGNLDCDDSRADVHTGATEICDLVDNDCDGIVDEGQTLPYYVDADGDGHGSRSTRMNVCPSEVTAAADQRDAGTAVPPWVTSSDDCDDSDSGRFTGC